MRFGSVGGVREAGQGIPGMTEDGFILVNGWFWNL